MRPDDDEPIIEKERFQPTALQDVRLRVQVDDLGKQGSCGQGFDFCDFGVGDLFFAFALGNAFVCFALRFGRPLPSFGMT
ncbi:MAG: hypothetical protein ACFB9M_20100 [Myxococcota bacterium]